uniref:Uncharacterized protein n=1 Tax=Arundo donax TaxID=35708 RepID=A0A0A9BYJ8_ARUDO
MLPSHIEKCMKAIQAPYNRVKKPHGLMGYLTTKKSRGYSIGVQSFP